MEKCIQLSVNLETYIWGKDSRIVTLQQNLSLLFSDNLATLKNNKKIKFDFYLSIYLSI